MLGIMTGYGIEIRQLQPEDVDMWDIDLQDNPVEQCVAVDGSDLGSCLAAVMLWDENTPKLLWSYTDGGGTPIEKFCQAVGTIVLAIHPHLKS